MNIKQSAWTGMVPVDDTALYVTDTGGRGRPVVYLNGAYADQSHWRRIIADLGSDYRHITYDERARGKSKRSADYSFEACVGDVDALLKARGVDRPLLVGWSYGGVLAWHWADRNPDRVLGVVCVDAFPVGGTGEAGRERIRKLFRRMRLLFPIAARLGLAARMTADQHADVNIELNEIAAASVPVLDRLTCPVRFVLATGDSLGTKDGEMEQGRTTLDPVLAPQQCARVHPLPEVLLAEPFVGRMSILARQPEAGEEDGDSQGLGEVGDDRYRAAPTHEHRLTFERASQGASAGTYRGIVSARVATVAHSRAASR